MLRRSFFLFFSFLFLLPLFSSCARQENDLPVQSQSESPVIVSSPLTVYALKLGEADCFLLQTASHLVILDTGEQQDGDKIVDVIERLGMPRIDRMILSHPDKDHIGGAAEIVKTGLVDSVMMPDYKKNSEEESALNEALQAHATEVQAVTQTSAFVLDGVKFTVYPTLLETTEDDASNAHSLGVLVEHGNNRLFFAGDAVDARLTEMAEQIPNPETVDLLKIPHHGRFNNRSDDLILTLAPKIAIICDSAKEPADHRILKLLNEVDAEKFQTSHGAVIVTSDGNRLHVEEG